MVRLGCPQVPQPSHTPLPRKSMSCEDKARIFSVYLRPWTLLRNHATPHVPHLQDLDVVLTDVLGHRRRLRQKQPAAQGTPPRRSFALAWEDYRTHHVVSNHAAHLIKSFLLTQMAESAEVEEEEETKQKEPQEAVSTAWASLDKIAELLAAESVSSSGKRQQHAEAVDVAKKLTRQMWQRVPDMETEIPLVLSKAGDISSAKCSSASVGPKTPAAAAEKKARLPSACLSYQGLTKASADVWFETLCSRGIETDPRRPRPRPSDEQQLPITRVIKRCLAECDEEMNDVDFRSEPLSFLLHGVPGADHRQYIRCTQHCRAVVFCKRNKFCTSSFSFERQVGMHCVVFLLWHWTFLL